MLIKRLFSAQAQAASISNTTDITSNVLKKIAEQYPNFYVKLNIFNFPFTVSRQDRIVLHRLKDVKVGDILKLDRIRELGSPDFTIKGRPWINPEFCHVEACVVEHGRGEKVKAKEPKKRKGHQRNVTIKPLTTTLLIRDIIIKEPKE